jgi:alkylated DNA repair dioxygenase AlkB
LDDTDAREYHNEYAALAFDGEERGGDLGRAHRAPPELLEAAAFVRSVVAEDPAPSAARCRAAQESEIPNFKGFFLGRFPLVSADFWTSDHLSERSRSMDAFSRDARARNTHVEENLNHPFPAQARWRPSVAFGNRYEDGADHVGYHSDFLLSLGPRPIIAGLSLGATRTFRLRSADGATVVSIPAPHNSLVVMRQDCQESWQHAVVKAADVRPHAAAGATRFSLTFRMARPDFAARARVECACGRVAALKAKNGAYYLTCNMAGGDASAKCNFYRRCDVAQREADRLRAEDAAALAAADG